MVASQVPEQPFQDLLHHHHASFASSYVFGYASVASRVSAGGPSGPPFWNPWYQVDNYSIFALPHYISADHCGSKSSGSLTLLGVAELL
jgi:hypothetical protein